jgi:hypothetical protein
MLISLKDRTAVAQFVTDTLANLEADSRLTMSIHPARSGDFYVLTAITELSADTARELEMFCSIMPGSTSLENTRDG